ncbi:MAG: rRNA maturation RNase YbeY [Dehalococcoidia bacterium]|nr:MAG: rRNA maturation RNase YbeY [Dehalococcoidia bacterium]
MEINVLFDEGLNDYLDANWLKDIVKQVLVTMRIIGEVEMGVVIASSQKVQDLNNIYRGKDVPTDVLSFTMNAETVEASEPAFTNPPDGIRHLGEVIINYPQAVKQAEDHQHSTRREVAILIIHGILHLLGYDHAEDGPAQQMTVKESAILESIDGGLA